MPNDFHPFWHLNRRILGYEYTAPPLPVLDPASSSRRRAEVMERRARNLENNRLQVARTGRILSRFEREQSRLPHCSLCTEHGHDKQLCRGCRSTGHNRGNCPQRARVLSTE